MRLISALIGTKTEQTLCSQSRIEHGADELVEGLDVVWLLQIAEATVAQHPLAFLIVAVPAGDDDAHARIDLLDLRE